MYKTFLRGLEVAELKEEDMPMGYYLYNLKSTLYL